MEQLKKLGFSTIGSPAIAANFEHHDVQPDALMNIIFADNGGSIAVVYDQEDLDAESIYMMFVIRPARARISHTIMFDACSAWNIIANWQAVTKQAIFGLEANVSLIQYFEEFAREHQGTFID